MKLVGLIVLLMALMAFTACNKGGNTGGTVVTKTGTGQAAHVEDKHDHSDPNHMHAEGEEHKEGEKDKEVSLPTSVQLANGESVPVVGVAKLDQDPAAHKGQIAIIGLVETVIPEKQAFTLCDATAEVGCKDGCCPASKFPVNVPGDKFDGNLPEVNQQVTVIGILTPAETGYTFDVREVRVGEETTITPKSDGSCGRSTDETPTEVQRAVPYSAQASQYPDCRGRGT